MPAQFFVAPGLGFTVHFALRYSHSPFVFTLHSLFRPSLFDLRFSFSAFRLHHSALLLTPPSSLFTSHFALSTLLSLFAILHSPFRITLHFSLFTRLLPLSIRASQVILPRTFAQSNTNQQIKIRFQSQLNRYALNLGLICTTKRSDAFPAGDPYMVQI